MARYATRRSRVPRPLTKRCVNTRIKRLPSDSVWARCSGTCSPADRAPTAINFVMQESTASLDEIGATSKRIVRRLVTIGENRLELLAMEVQEERERLLHALLLALAVAALALLAGITLTAAIVVGLWSWSPVAVLLILTCLYGAAGFALCRRLNGLM